MPRGREKERTRNRGIGGEVKEGKAAGGGGGKNTAVSLLTFSWREAFQVHFLDHIPIAVVLLDIAVTMLSIICALFFI